MRTRQASGRVKYAELPARKRISAISPSTEEDPSWGSQVDSSPAVGSRSTQRRNRSRASTVRASEVFRKRSATVPRGAPPSMRPTQYPRPDSSASRPRMSRYAARTYSSTSESPWAAKYSLEP